MNSGKTNFAYSVIKKKIIEWELPPLGDLSEEQLQKELNISRTPVREAILKLASDGFVYIYPRKGTIVSEVTYDLLKEIYQIRELNESFIAIQACNKLSESWLRQIRQKFQLPSPELALEQLRFYYVCLDFELHTTILNNCDNRFLRNQMQNVYDHDHRIRMHASNPVHDNSITEHIAIIDALLSKDEAQIKAATQEHLHNSWVNSYSSLSK